MSSSIAGLHWLARVPLIALLRAYRIAVSPLIGNVCRFEPSCSVYAEQAIRRFGAWKGTYLTTLRLLRCHPFAKGGLDPVPPAASIPPRRRFT